MERRTPLSLAQLVQGFYDAFPDTVVIMDAVRGAGENAVYLWTYEGTNNGPGGTATRCVSTAGKPEICPPDGRRDTRSLHPCRRVPRVDYRLGAAGGGGVFASDDDCSTGLPPCRRRRIARG